VELVLPIHLKGTAAGTREGGVVEHIKHEVKILCPVVSIPDHLTLNVNNLHVGQSLTLADLPLPDGAKLLTDAGEVVVMCVTPVEVDETAATAEPGEPEVIGRKKDEEEGAAEE
ncbi:MAG: 50S ribosomal protein L25, partial [Planctomycetota bacterium]